MSTSSSRPLSRQWHLLQLLSSETGLTADELAEHAGVAIRTIRRDLQTFRENDFPIEVTNGAHNRKTYRMRNNVFTCELDFGEAAALYLGRQFFERMAGTLLWRSAQSAFEQIEQRLSTGALEYIRRVAYSLYDADAGVSDYSERATLIDRLHQACEETRAVRLRYQSASSQAEKNYQLNPYVIVIYSHSLYVIGESDDRVRTFKVDRVSDVELLDENFDRPKDFEAGGFLEHSFGVWQRGEKPFTVRIHFSADASKYASEKRWFQHQELEEQSDGSVILSAEVSDTVAIRSWICSFRGAAQVLEPRSLIDELIADVNQLARVHSQPGST
ncbi:MAG: helix-turn-helix transcriptional regulator [Planctomycetota bacterium]|jgi:predicted DNA-binding transcriptional regulator YafY